MMRRVLMIAFHFPPFRGSSGLQRTLAFGRYLSEHGWAPVILAPRASAYPTVSPDSHASLPEPAVVHRTATLDVGRHLSLQGRYFSWMATPDRWNTWPLSAIPAGLRLVRRYRPDAIWSTYPIPTAHLIGLGLHRLTGIPWVADFRDPMVYEGWPTTRRQRRVFSWIESASLHYCSTAVFTTPSTRALYAERYPQVADDRLRVIANGYDESTFAGLHSPEPGQGNGSAPYTLVHSGLLEPEDRDPYAFFEALRKLREDGVVTPERINIILRASGHEERYARQLDALGITDLVHLEPAIPYEEALGEMMQADGLLLFQGRNCNRQIPAKAYEYMRARRPIFALADPEGDTAALMRKHGIDSMAPLDAPDQLARRFRDFLEQIDLGKAPTPDADEVSGYSRARLTGELASVLDAVSV